MIVTGGDSNHISPSVKHVKTIGLPLQLTVGSTAHSSDNSHKVSIEETPGRQGITGNFNRKFKRNGHSLHNSNPIGSKNNQLPPMAQHSPMMKRDELFNGGRLA